MRRIHCILVLIFTTFTLAAAAEEHELTITSQPAGAMVFIDNAYVGVTPVTTDLAAGEHMVKLMRRGYREWNAAVSVPHDKGRLEVTLAALKRGSITVTSEPRGGKVYLDGREAGVTPLKLRDLANDTYEVRVQMPQYETFRETVEITDGEDIVLSAKLTSSVELFYRNAIENNPLDLVRYTDLAHYFIVQNRFDDARELYLNGVDVAGKIATAGEPVMRFYQELGKVYGARFAFISRDQVPAFRESFSDIIEYAIENGPPSVSTYQQLVTLYTLYGRNSAIMQMIDRMHADQPDRNVYKEFGLIYLNRGTLAMAIELLGSALERRSDAKTRIALGSAHHRAGDLDAALAHYSQAEHGLLTNAQQLDLLEKQTRLHLRRDDHDKALAKIDKAEDLGQTTQAGKWGVLKFRALSKAGRCEEAEEIAHTLRAFAITPREQRDADEMLRRLKADCAQNR